MNDVSESLKHLVERRLREMGARRGRGGPLSLLEVWQTLPEGPDGKRPVSYESVRRIGEGQHRNIGDRVADAVATMLDVPVGQVLKAAGQRPRLGRFELPRRADQLTERERQVVVSVVDVILDAASDRPSTGDAEVPKGEIQRKLREAQARQGDLSDRASGSASEKPRRTGNG